MFNKSYAEVHDMKKKQVFTVVVSQFPNCDCDYMTVKHENSTFLCSHILWCHLNIFGMAEDGNKINQMFLSDNDLAVFISKIQLEMSNDSNRSDPETVRQPSHTDSHAPDGDICSDHDSFGDACTLRTIFFKIR